MRQQKAIAALMQTMSIEQAARTSGISSRQIHRWLKDPAFRQELSATQGEIMQGVIRALTTMQQAAVKTIYETMTSFDAPAWVRIRAAEMLLETFTRFYSTLELDRRLSELEKELEDAERKSATSAD